MKDCRILYIHNTGAKLYSFVCGACVLDASFNSDEDGFSQLKATVSLTPFVSTHVMIDISDEEYRITTIPHLRGKERNNVLTRQLNKTFPDHVYKYSDIVGRDNYGRRDDIVMCMAITKPDVVDPWLDVLRHNNVSLDSIVSVPLFQQKILDYFDDAKGAVILVSEFTGGLRVTFFQDHKMKLSRTIPVIETNPVKKAEIIREEIDKTHRYLIRSRFISSETIITTYVIEDSNVLLPLISSTADMVSIALKPVETVVFYESIGVLPEDGCRDNQYLLMTLYAMSSRSNQYASDKDLLIGKLYRGNRVLSVSALCAFFVVCCIASLLVYQGYGFDKEIDSINAMTENIGAQYEELQLQLPVLDVSVVDMKNIVQQVEYLNASSHDPQKSLAHLSNILLLYPSLKIEYISWYQSQDEGVVSDDGSDDEVSNEDASNVEVLSIAGTVEPFSGDYKSAIDVLNRFISSLKSGGYFNDVMVVKLPIDLQSKETVAGRITPTFFEPARAEFSLEMRL